MVVKVVKQVVEGRMRIEVVVLLIYDSGTDGTFRAPYILLSTVYYYCTEYCI